MALKLRQTPAKLAALQLIGSKDLFTVDVNSRSFPGRVASRMIIKGSRIASAHTSD